MHPYTVSVGFQLSPPTSSSPRSLIVIIYSSVRGSYPPGILRSSKFGSLDVARAFLKASLKNEAMFLSEITVMPPLGTYR